MGEKAILTGNKAAAIGAKLSRAKVVAAYPITPQTTIVEYIAEMVEKGEMDARYIRVESEHSAMAACIGAESMGVRSFTATSSQGLALMFEMVHWAAGARLPIVMAIVNRSLGPPWNIHTEHQDTISQRDTGWLQAYVTDCQEIVDTIIQMYKVCESEDVVLPGMVALDGFILSHTSMPVDIPDQELVDEYLPEYKPKHYVLDPENPFTIGNLVLPNWYMEMRYSMEEGMKAARKRIEEAGKEFEKFFGRRYGMVEEYLMDDAEYAIMCMGTMASEAKVAVKKLREEGVKAGLVRIRFYRPFPIEQIREVGRRVRGITVIDRNISFGLGGALCSEVKSAVYGLGVTVSGFIAGLGGRDVTYEEIAKMVRETIKDVKKGVLSPETRWIGVRRWW